MKYLDCMDCMLTPAPIARPYLHDRLTIAELGENGFMPVVSLIGVVHSEYQPASDREPRIRGCGSPAVRGGC
ncbi:MAG: hypothetical protein ACRERU_14685 [Methylococcales bacterium]